LLDVVLQLITFFMMLVHFGTKIEGASAEIRLPVAPAGLPGDELALDRMVVTIDARGALVLAGRGLAGAGRRRVVGRAGRTPARRPGDPRRAGRRAADAGRHPGRQGRGLRAVRKALISAQERGFAHFTLVVLRSLR
jgi:biopolymer transport protein ExbD